ncbi:hypothetical protein AB0F17_17305 [Nonomuraea sp. NPDC026600]|uniref:hypothetical protein n=1 Tax=Nonomuraea sp. NPDC026600 TaxID=3155363 RepID=UPI0033EFD589
MTTHGTDLPVSPVPPAARERLAKVADALIPAGAGLPSAAQAGVHAELLDQVARARPDLIPPLLEALEALGADPDLASVERLAADAPRLHEAITLVVAGAYLMSPRVMASLKYSFQKAKIVDPGEITTVVAEGLLDQVIERGPRYRLPPDAPSEHGS